MLSHMCPMIMFCPHPNTETKSLIMVDWNKTIPVLFSTQEAAYLERWHKATDVVLHCSWLELD